MSAPIPQVILTLSPDGQLIAEVPLNGPVRRQIALTEANAGKRIMQELLRQKRAQEGTRHSPRHHSGPDWELIARHPQVEIRRLLPGPGLGASSSRATPEDLGL